VSSPPLFSFSAPQCTGLTSGGKSRENYPAQRITLKIWEINEITAISSEGGRRISGWLRMEEKRKKRYSETIGNR